MLLPLWQPSEQEASCLSVEKQGRCFKLAKQGKDSKTLRGPALCFVGGLLLLAAGASGLYLLVVHAFDAIGWWVLALLAVVPSAFFLIALGFVHLRASQRG
jgi:hypothetical protein